MKERPELSDEVSEVSENDVYLVLKDIAASLFKIALYTESLSDSVDEVIQDRVKV